MCVSKWFTLVAALCVVAGHSIPAVPQSTLADGTGEFAAGAVVPEALVDPKRTADQHSKSSHDTDEKASPKKGDVALLNPLQSVLKKDAPEVSDEAPKVPEVALKLEGALKPEVALKPEETPKLEEAPQVIEDVPKFTNEAPKEPGETLKVLEKTTMGNKATPVLLKETSKVPPQAPKDNIGGGYHHEALPSNGNSISNLGRSHPVVEVAPSTKSNNPSQTALQPDSTAQKSVAAMAPSGGRTKGDQAPPHGGAHGNTVHPTGIPSPSKEQQALLPGHAKTTVKEDAPKPEMFSPKIPPESPAATKIQSSEPGPSPVKGENAVIDIDDKGDLLFPTTSGSGLDSMSGPLEEPKPVVTEQKEVPRPPSSSGAKPDGAQGAEKGPAEKVPTSNKPSAGEPLESTKEEPAQDKEPRPEVIVNQENQEDDFPPSGFEQPSGGLDGRGPVGGVRPEKPLDVSVVSPMGDGGRFSGISVEDDSHFFAYFLTAVVLCVLGYLAFHNKRKILALIVEGRHERLRRNNGAYRRLDNVDEDSGVRKGRGSF